MTPEDLSRKLYCHQSAIRLAALMVQAERQHGVRPPEYAGIMAGVAWTTLSSHLGDKIAREVFDAIASSNTQPTFQLDLNVVRGGERRLLRKAL